MRHRSLRRAVPVGLFLAAFGPLAAQAPPPPEIERLSHVARLWGTVRYLHPFIAYRDIDWDAALLEALPKIRAAGDSYHYELAVQSMLERLGDPVTRVLPPPPESQTQPIRTDLFRWLDGEVLYIDLRPEVDLMNPKVRNEGAAKLLPELRRARRVVLDLRSPIDAQPRSFSPLELLDLDGPLIPSAATAPAQRYLLHSGYEGQTFRGSGGYFSAFVTLFAQAYTPAADVTPKRIVFLVTPFSQIPPQALALQTSGDAAIVSDGGLPSEGGVVQTRIVDLGEGVRTQVRLSELVPQPGWPGLHADLVVPDLIVQRVKPDGTHADEGLEAALHLCAKGWPHPKKAKTAAALPSGAWRADKTYPEATDPSAEMRLLAVIRFWNVIDLFYPYKTLIGDWDAVLPEFLGKMAASQGARGYAWTLAEMAARIADAHTGINGHPELEALYGTAPAPVAVRWIEDACVVTAKAPISEVEAAHIELGDAVEAVDRRPIGERMEELRPYVAGATPRWLKTRLCGAALMGAKDSSIDLVLRGLGGERKELHAKRSVWKRPDGPEVVRLLSGNLGYADLTRLARDEVDGMFEKFKDTRGIVFDMRGYPRGTAWSIGPRLNVGDHPVAAQFRRNLVSAGATEDEGSSGFYFSQPIGTRKDGRYAHPTVMLIDERAISQSEHSGLFYEAANGTRFIGSPTAGSNGDVTDLSLPGGIDVFFTGHDVRHADGRQLQRVGLVPDVAVSPTRAGLKAGKDEVLERAIQDLEETLAKQGERP